MSKNTNINNFATEIEKFLKEYGDEAQEILNNATEKYTRQALSEIKDASPVKTGKYKRGWRSKTEKGRLSVNGVVYNITSFQKTHLLENGHLTRNGGRTKAIPHIAPVNSSIQDKFEKEIISKL